MAGDAFLLEAPGDALKITGIIVQTRGIHAQRNVSDQRSFIFFGYKIGDGCLKGKDLLTCPFLCFEQRFRRDEDLYVSLNGDPTSQAVTLVHLLLRQLRVCFGGEAPPFYPHLARTALAQPATLTPKRKTCRVSRLEETCPLVNFDLYALRSKCYRIFTNEKKPPGILSFKFLILGFLLRV